MVNISNHGGSCCGARHVHGFGTGDSPLNITQMHNHVASAPDRLTEIILNRNQCRSSPDLLAAMAARGFVLTTGFKNGNHDSDVFVFHRSDRRLRLDNTERDFGFVWNGQLASPTLHGNLDALVATVAAATGIPPIYTNRGSRLYNQYISRYPRQMVLRYDGPAVHLRNTTFRLPELAPGWAQVLSRLDRYTPDLRVRQDVTGDLKKLAMSSFVIEQFGEAAEPQQAPPLGNQRYATAANEAGAAPAAAERIVYTTHHNVYRDGRIGAGYPSSEEARNAAPRAAQRLTRNIYNTGRVEDVVG